MAWEIRGVPGAPPRTSWFDRDVPAMWRALENQQSDDHWRLVAGWRKASELTATHLSRLEQYRTNLIDAWPPDRNAAAAAYVSRLDFLIQNVRATHDTAAANYSTLAATVGALASARRDLKPLYDEYVAKSEAMRAHAELAAFNAASEGPTVIGAAPAAPADLERLNNRARAIMYTLSHTLVEAEAAIRQPPVYQAMTDKNIGDPDVYGSTTGARTFTQRPSDNSKSTPGPRESDRFLGPTSSTSPSARLSNESTSGVTKRPVVTYKPSGPSGGTIRSSTAPSGERTRLAISRDGVIGAHSPQPSTSEALATTTRRAPYVNPAGGLIGRSSQTNPTLGHVGPTQPILGTPGTRPGQDTRRAIEHRYHDTQWEVPKGVPPVITPVQRNPKIDPGPAIGLEP